VTKPSKTDVVVSGIAVVIVTAMLVITIVLAITEPSGPPDFAIGSPELLESQSGQLIEIEVENTGGRAAESFTLVATLPDGSEIEQDGGWLSPGETDRLTYLVGDDVNVDEIAFEVVAFDATG
jgi:uncharacterized protein (TIGR02588 family)